MSTNVLRGLQAVSTPLLNSSCLPSVEICILKSKLYVVWVYHILPGGRGWLEFFSYHIDLCVRGILLFHDIKQSNKIGLT